MNKPTRLIATMKHWGITSDNLAEATGTSLEKVGRWLSGDEDLMISEAVAIHNQLFPSYDLFDLFDRAEIHEIDAAAIEAELTNINASGLSNNLEKILAAVRCTCGFSNKLEADVGLAGVRAEVEELMARLPAEFRLPVDDVINDMEESGMSFGFRLGMRVAGAALKEDGVLWHMIAHDLES